MIINKKGEEIIEETVKIVIAGIGIFLLLFLLYSLIAPNFNPKDETLQAYFNSLKGEIKKADSGQIGEFSVWVDTGKTNEDDISLVYFGNLQTFEDSAGVRFFLKKSYPNYLCLCRKSLIKEEKPCDSRYCISMKKSIDSPWKDGSGRWSIGKGVSVKIEKKLEQYVFYS